MSNNGQSLMELVIVLAVIIIVVGALVFATIASLRNATFAKNQSQATKLAQEGIEKVRSSRDHSDPIEGNFMINGTAVISWQDPNLWSKETGQISKSCIPNCYFRFNGSIFQYLTAASDIPSSAEDVLGDGRFKRVVILSDDNSYQVQKNVTVIVQWKDFSGNHQSILTTILRKI